jgi:hypothetical protein
MTMNRIPKQPVERHQYDPEEPTTVYDSQKPHMSGKNMSSARLCTVELIQRRR